MASEDEQYGHEVLNTLTETYPLDTNDQRINRVRGIVDRLTAAAGANQNPWHVHVLVDDTFKNAAATRGNFVFVWTGMMRAVQSDAELATVLAHEISHVLAGHTEPDTAEEVGRIIAGVAGTVSGQILGSQVSYGGPIGDIAGSIIQAGLEALLVNPDSQRKELEADQVGLFVMADAKYNPNDAVAFWDRVKSDPDFGGTALGFLSTHPASADRVEHLKQFLPAAEERYRAARAGKPRPKPQPVSPPPTNDPNGISFASSKTASPRGGIENWVVVESQVKIFTEPSRSSAVVGTLAQDTPVEIEMAGDGWIKISRPLQGFARGTSFSPR